MRLDKFVSHATGLPRQTVRQYIRQRRVRVDGRVITKADHSLTDTAQVELEGAALSLPMPRYFMLYKPAGYVCATQDADHPTVLDLMPDQRPGLSVAGRLDKDTTGLVLISDDGDWVHRVISPRRECRKIYHATLDAAVESSHVEQFQAGILLRGESKPTAPATLIAHPGTLAEVHLTEGKYHQVKRMFAACGRHVVALHRLQIGDIVLDPQLDPGQYRALTDAEIHGI